MQIGNKRIGAALLKVSSLAIALSLWSAGVAASYSINTSFTNNGNYTLNIGSANGVDFVRLEERFELDSEYRDIYYGPGTDKVFNKKYAGNYYYRTTTCIPAEPGFDGYCYTGDEFTVTVVKNNRPTTAVILGDSFASGEGGRWRGNALENSNDYGGTDGSVVYGGQPFRDFDRVYEPESLENGCHRSYTASVHHLTNTPFSGATDNHAIEERENYPALKDQVDVTVNLACSGARNKHLWPVSEGGVSLKQEAPQLTQLKWLTRSNDITLIVVGVGGNDMGFADVVTQCIAAWTGHVGIGQGPAFNDFVCDNAINGAISSLTDVKTKTEKSIKLVKDTMASEGKTYGTDYRIVLTSYPSILPRGNDFKFPVFNRGNQATIETYAQGQCPFTNYTADKMNNELMPAMSDAFRSVAKSAGVDFLDVVGAYGNNRLCEDSTRRDFYSTVNRDYHETYGEYMRFVDFDLFDFDKILDGTAKFADFHFLWAPSRFWRNVKQMFNPRQGYITESMHPNQLGQKAVGWCLRGWWNNKNALMDGEYSCARDGMGPIADKSMVARTSSRLNARTLVAID